MDTEPERLKEIEWHGLINKIIGKHMKQFKLVDSLNKNEQIRHIEACNWYMREMAKKHLTLEKKPAKMRIITIINKQEICIKEK